MHQVGVLHKQMDAKLKTGQARYKCNFDRTVRHTPQYYSRQHFFIDRPQVQMTESARIADPPLTILLPKTFGPMKVISATSQTVTVDDNGIQNTISIDRATLATYKALRNARTD